MVIIAPETIFNADTRRRRFLKNLKGVFGPTLQPPSLADCQPVSLPPLPNLVVFISTEKGSHTESGGFLEWEAREGGGGKYNNNM